MRVARLGVVIDPSGAKTGAAEVNAAQQSMAATATRTANERVTAEKKAAIAQGQAIGEQVKAIQSAERAQNRAVNEAKRAAQVATEYAAAQRKAAEAEERRAAATQRAAEVQTRARALMEAQAYKMNAAFDASGTAAKGAGAALGSLREPLTSVASHALGTSGSFGTLASALSMVTLGSATTVGVVGALALIAGAIQMATEKTREFKKAQDEANRALEELAKRKRQGAGGDLGDQVETRAKTLRALAAEVAKLEAELARPTISMSNNNTGATDTRAVAAQRIKAKQDEYNKLAEEAELGERELQAIRDRAAAQEMATLISNNNATKTERAKTVEQVKTLQAELARLTKLGGNESERTRLITDIKTLTDALSGAGKAAAIVADKQETAADKVIKAEQNYFKALAKVTGDSEDAVADYLAGMSKARMAELTASDKQKKELAEIAELRAKNFKNAQEEIDVLQFQVSLIGKTKQEQEGLIDIENYRLAKARQFTDEQAAQYEMLQRTLRNAKAKTDEWERSMANIIVAVDSIANAFGGVGEDIGRALQLSVQLTDALMKAQAARKAKGTDDEKSTAAASQAANGALAGGFVGFVVSELVGGFQKIAQGNREAAAAIEEAARKLAAFNDNVREFERSLAQIGQGEFAQARTRVGEQVGELFKQLAGRFTTLQLPESGQVSSEYLRDLLGGGNGPGRVAKPTGELAKALELLARNAEIAEKALAKEQAMKVAAMAEDLQVRRLVAEGRSAEADALRLQLQQQRELAAAQNDFKGAEGFEAFIAALKEVQAAELAAAEAARIAKAAEEALSKKRQQVAFALDVQARTQSATGDNRGAFVTRQQIDQAGQLAAAEDLLKAGTITQQMFEDLARVIGIEMTQALEDFDKAARQAVQDQQDDLRVRALVATGRDAEAAQARREIANRNELADVTDAALIAQILYVQGLEAEAAAKAAAAALAARVQQENDDITRRMVDAYRTVNPAKAAELEALQLQIDRTRQLTDAVDDATRARLAELFALEDEAAAIRKLADEHEKAAAAAEKLANLSASVNEEYLRATGQTFEADRLALERRRDEQLKAANEAGAAADVVAKIMAIFDANFAKLIQSTFDTATSTTPTNNDPNTEFVTRSGARSISTTEALRLIDVSISQLTVLRNIERNTEGAGAGGVSVHVTVQGGAFSGTPGDVGRGIAQAIVPFVTEQLGRRVGVDRRLAGSDAL